MASSEVEIKGLSEFHKLMSQLPVRIEKNITKGMLRAGQKVMMAGTKNLLNDVTKRDSGALEKSIRIRFARKSEKYGWVRSYLIAGNKDAFYSHMIEFGTASYYTGSGESVGRPYEIKAGKAASLFFGGKAVEKVMHKGIKPRPFMRPAADMYSAASIDAMVAYVQKRIPKEIKKAGL